VSSDYYSRGRGLRYKTRQHAGELGGEVEGVSIVGERHFAAFKKDEPKLGAWIEANANVSNFALSLLRRIRAGLALSPKQLDALKRAAGG